MALQIRGFKPDNRRALDRSLTLIQERLKHPPALIPRDLRATLQDILSGPRPTVSLVYGGAQGVCQQPYARSAGYRVLLCEKAFLPAADTGKARLPAVLFHELIHMAGGWELDAEAFENAWFTSTEGARRPTREDWTIFKEDGYQGVWVHVDPRTRRVTDHADRLILTFAAPTLHRPPGRRTPPEGRTRRPGMKTQG